MEPRLSLAIRQSSFSYPMLAAWPTSDFAPPFPRSLPGLLRMFAPSRYDQEKKGGREDCAYESNGRTIHFVSPLNWTQSVQYETALNPVLLFYRQNSAQALGRLK
jgi:hypothetical protein